MPKWIHWNHEGNTPIYKHDCDGCSFLGRHTSETDGKMHVVDMYLCEPHYREDNGLSSTILARYGNEPHEYSSTTVYELERALLRGHYRIRRYQYAPAYLEAWRRAQPSRPILLEEEACRLLGIKEDQ